MLKTAEVFGDASIFGYNVTLSYNVIAAAFTAGVTKLVMGSSLTIYGFYYPSRWSAPEYLPVDEDYPLNPQDPYSVSKLVIERACDAFPSKSDIQIDQQAIRRDLRRLHAPESQREAKQSLEMERPAVDVYRCSRCGSRVSSRGRSKLSRS